MGRVIILNGSPRAASSNSGRYAKIFQKHCSAKTECCNITKSNHSEICSKLEHFSDALLVFPLYADGIPATLLLFLKTLEQNPPENRPVISVLVNCGFFEYSQNDTAVDMIRLFCRQNGYRFGASLKIGSGEAILNTPFKMLAAWKIKKLAAAIAGGKYSDFSVTMPIGVKAFVKASEKYWIDYGRRNGVTKEQMQTKYIEQRTKS